MPVIYIVTHSYNKVTGEYPWAQFSSSWGREVRRLAPDALPCSGASATASGPEHPTDRVSFTRRNSDPIRQVTSLRHKTFLVGTRWQEELFVAQPCTLCASYLCLTCCHKAAGHGQHGRGDSHRQPAFEQDVSVRRIQVTQGMPRNVAACFCYEVAAASWQSSWMDRPVCTTTARSAKLSFEQ